MSDPDVPPSTTSEVPAETLRAGDTIVESNDRGKVVRTIVRRRHAGCDRYHTHVETTGGKNWCYDARMPVEVER